MTDLDELIAHIDARVRHLRGYLQHGATPDQDAANELRLKEAILARLESLRDADKELPGEPDDYPQVPAAFINAIAEEGTKSEAIKYLAKTWNELCAIRKYANALRTKAVALHLKATDAEAWWKDREQKVLALTIESLDARRRAETAEADAKHVRQANENYRRENEIIVAERDRLLAMLREMAESVFSGWMTDDPLEGQRFGCEHCGIRFDEIGDWTKIKHDDDCIVERARSIIDDHAMTERGGE